MQRIIFNILTGTFSALRQHGSLLRFIMKFIISLIAFILCGSPALSLSLSVKSYIGHSKATIQSTYSCAPSFLSLADHSRLICNDNDVGTFIFVLKGNRVVSVEINPSNQPLTFDEATSLLKSQCAASDSNTSFICRHDIQATVKDRGFAITINVCEQGHC